MQTSSCSPDPVQDGLGFRLPILDPQVILHGVALLRGLKRFGDLRVAGRNSGEMGSFQLMGGSLRSPTKPRKAENRTTPIKNRPGTGLTLA